MKVFFSDPDVDSNLHAFTNSLDSASFVLETQGHLNFVNKKYGKYFKSVNL